MSVSEETLAAPAENAAQPDPEADRQALAAARQERLAEWLAANSVEPFLILDPANASWLTAGGWLGAGLGPHEGPALLFGSQQRRLVATEADAARLLEGELAGLGFLPRTWSWRTGRAALLRELCPQGAVACDQLAEGCRLVEPPLRQWRRELGAGEQKTLRGLGRLVNHALEATCRSLRPEEKEHDVAAQLSHRLLHHGAEPVSIGVAADGRSRRQGCCGFTAAEIRQSALLTVTARRNGLYATASRTVCFGPPDETLLKEFDTATKVSAGYIATTWTDSRPREILQIGQRYCEQAGFDPLTQLGAPGYITGRSPVELALTPETDDLLQLGWAITWQASLGAASTCDTFLVTADGPKLLTPTESWPLKRIRIQGMKLVRPDILQR